MFINLKVLSKNQNSLKKFLILFNSFWIKKKKENLYLIKKKLTKIVVKTSKSESVSYKFKTCTHGKIYKIKKRKYFMKKKKKWIF